MRFVAACSKMCFWIGGSQLSFFALTPTQVPHGAPSPCPSGQCIQSPLPRQVTATPKVPPLSGEAEEAGSEGKLCLSPAVRPETSHQTF